MFFSRIRSSLNLNEYRKRSCTQHSDSYSSFILGTFPPRWVQNFSPQKIYFYRVPFLSRAQGQPHRAKQSHPSQKRLQTAQIVLISLNFRSKKPIEHKKILQALYQYLKDLMANPVDCDTRDGCTWLGAGMGAMHLFFTDQTDPSDTRIPPPPCVHRG